MEEKDKLTIQEAARYLGQDIKISREFNSWIENLVGVDLDDIKQIRTNHNKYYDGDYTIQLVLRSIEDMTEEEYEKYSDLAELVLKAKTAIDSVKYWSKIVNYLRSIGVDCDDLIKQGKAIRKEK